MERGRPVGVDTQKVEKPLPKLGCGDWVAVADGACWKAVNPDDVLEEQRRHVRCTHGFRSRNEVGLLGQAVDDDEDSVMAIRGR